MLFVFILNTFVEILLKSKLSFILEKSKINIVAAEHLFDNNYYAPSVHCCYYSVVQRMIHTICKNKNVSCEQLTQQAHSSGKGSHTVYLDEFLNILKSNSRNFKNNFKQVKMFRTKSDYGDCEIDQITCDRAIQISKELIREINNN